MMQTVHYFYGYLQVVETIGEQVNMSVPSGGFGNLCAGGLARKMGLPIKYLVAASNENGCLHRVFSEGRFTKEDIIETPSSAIDILIPYNFWRYLYFCIDNNTERIKKWMDEFKTTGIVTFDKATFETYKKGFLSNSTSAKDTLDVIDELYTSEAYLLDPHGAVSLQATDVLKNSLGSEKLICFATAHPSKFPEVIKKALHTETLPKEATHKSIEKAKGLCEKVYLCEHSHLEDALIHAMETNWDLTKGN
jgi:threonine synthase